MMSEGGATPPDAARLQAPLARLLRPLVRLAIRSGITFPALADLLRELYVNVAEHEFALAAKQQTDSRVSLLTGIHRKEVSRLRGAGAPVSVVPAAISRTSRIMARWLADENYTDAAGHPLPLPRSAEPGEASFDSLVESVTRDVRPRVVLDEWIDRGLVTRDMKGRVVLADNAFVPRADTEQQLYYLGRNLHDHIAAAVTNVEGEQPRFLERAVHYDGLSEEVAAALETRSREIAMGALQQANRDAHALASPEPDGSWRWIFGVYVYREAVEPTPPTDGQASDEGEGHR